MYKRHAWWSITSLLVILSLVLAACAGAAQPGAPAEQPAQEAAAEPTKAAEEEAAPAEEEAALGSTLIGEIEGPDIITNVDEFPSEFGEAPMLKEMVDAGSLPPVAERLPVREDLLVIKPVHEIGKYGGTWRRGFTGPGADRSALL